ncbi:hypothetical protein BaRGS_00037923, partial [Batillaria attramentaria]
YLDGQPSVYYRWPEIARLTQNKKIFEIDNAKEFSPVSNVVFKTMCLCLSTPLPSQLPTPGGVNFAVHVFQQCSMCFFFFTQEDTETAKYVCRLGQLQHRFYKSNRGNLRDVQQVQPTQVDTQQELTQSQTSLVYLQERVQQDVPQTVTAEDYYRQSQQSLDSGAPTPAPQVDPVYANRAALLPAYRPSPDYETVMRQRIAQAQIQETPQTIGNSQVYSHPEGISYSQPEIRQANLQPVFVEEGNYVNAAAIRSYNHNIYANVFNDGHNYYALRGGVGSGGERGTNLAVHTTYSSPELNVQPPQADFPSVTAGETVMTTESLTYHFRPPPPYPRTSSSTPDLAIQAMGVPPASDQPDLVSSQPALSAGSLGVGGGQVHSDHSVESVPEVAAMPAVSQNVPVTAESGLPEVVNMPLAHLQVVDAAGDQEDTSSEHSYATFHAKESDESSDDMHRDIRRDSKTQIQIRMLGPKEAPPQSKTKEVATLRESFRRMMIARSGSMRGSRRSMRESVEGKSTEPVNLTTVTEQALDISSSPQTAPVSNISMTPDVLVHTGIPVPESDAPDMQEILEKLGDPPPYPGPKPSTQASPPEPVPGVSPREDLSQVVPPPTSFTSPMLVRVAERRDVSDGAAEQKDDSHQENMAESGSETEVTVTKTEQTEDTQSEKEGGEGGEQEPDVDYASDSDSEKGSTVQRLNMGPLKMAAMNGLTLSRSMIMALMNDESRAPKDERRKILESKISDGQVFAEFEEIPKKAPSLECNVAKAPHNQPRNRFKDVLPYDATRVKLTARKDNPDGYINASHVKLSAANTEWWFVATQAPLPDTTVDFWQMVWEQEVDVIAMLTAFQELGKQKCFIYWPQETGLQHIQKYGDFEVELQFMHDSLCYLTSGIMVRHMPSRKEKMVWHLQYTDWPDHGCPEDTYGFLGFLDEVESVSRLAESEEGSGKKSPVVIHCSAGVGRTGVVILTMVMKWCLEHNHSVDLPKALTGIRNQRMHMVQTLGQYQFIHDTLIQYLKNTRLI